MEFRPGVFILPAAADFVFKTLLISSEYQAAIYRADFRRQEAEAVVQVIRRRKREGLLVVVGGKMHLPALAVDGFKRLAGKFVVAGEQAVAFYGVLLRFFLGFRLRGLGVQEQGQQVVPFVAVVSLVFVIKGFGIGAFGHGFHGEGFLGFGIMHFHEGGRVADVFVGLLVFLFEDFQYALVAAHFGVVALVNQVGDDRRLFLAVAVYPAVALLEHHERPGQIEMHQPVREVMQVDALRGHIGTQQYAEFTFWFAEFFDDFLLFEVAHTAVQNTGGIVFELEVALQLAVQPVEGFDAFAEDHQAVFSVGFLPAVLFAAEQVQQIAVFVEVGRGNVTQRQQQAVEGLDFLLFVFADFLLGLQLFDALLYGHFRRSRGAEDGFLQADAHQLAIFGGAVLAPVGEGHVQQCLVGGFFFRAGVEVEVVHYPFLEFLLYLVPDVFFEAADHQAFVAEIFFGVVIWVGNGGGVQHVHQAGERPRLAVVGRGGKHDQGV